VLTIKNPIQNQSLTNNLNQKIIIIDPGHGGNDPGAMRNNVLEKDITLEIAKLVVRKLKQQGATVYMTRNDDTFVSLNDRVVFSNNKKPDIFVSVHINACENESVHGIETHYFKEDSLDFAKHVHKSIILRINDKDRGILKSRFYVIRNTDMPAILLELGFISNEEERKLMQTPEKQNAFADAITEGIINYFKNMGVK
ncbi:N-acetylmuramoyl-L-alanine amidase, partial [bacterium]|nr:N-acetylmuramoyl-L-alanine amidase [bacterium]